MSNIFKVKANEFEFSFTEEQAKEADLIKRTATEFNLLIEHRSVNAKIISEDLAAGKLNIEVEGDSFEIIIIDELNQELEKMGFGVVSNKQIKEVKAPMPGLVLEISVIEGQELIEGDKILILSAMKMENSILIHTNATIKRIAVTSGQAVEKGQVLVELE